MKNADSNKTIAKVIGLRLVLGLFFISALMVLLLTVVVNRQMIRHVAMITESTQNHLMTAAQSLAKFISAEELDRYHTIEDTRDPEYQAIKEQLIRFSEEHNILYAYYWRSYGKDGQHIVDNDTDPDEQVGPWSIFEIEEIARDGLAGNIGVTDLGTYTPEWGGLISGYAPVYDIDGNFYCVAGVDISDEFILLQRKDSRNMTILQIAALLISVTFGVLNMLLYLRKAHQIEEAHVKLQYFNNNLRRAFSTYLSEDVVEEIVSDPTRLQLGGIKRNMTAMFTDVKNFAHIAEVLAPEKLVDLLNYYLSTMSDVILDQKGTIDKFEGNAIVSFFGAPLNLPDHALRACVTAIMMKRLETEVNSYVEKNGLSPSPLHTRMGINSGDMVVGNMGTMRKMNYTIISNAVNLAARLEGVNKQYGTWILASEDTIKETQGKLLTRRLDKIRVVGINEPVRIREVLEIFEDAPADLLNRINLFHRAHDHFESRNWKEAMEGFSRVLEQYPDDMPSVFYTTRCRQYLSFPPPNDWDGVFSFDEK